MKDFVSSNSVCNQTRTKSDECDLSITSVITDRTGRNEFLSPTNHDRYNFKKKIIIINTSISENVFKRDIVLSKKIPALLEISKFFRVSGCC